MTDLGAIDLLLQHATTRDVRSAFDAHVAAVLASSRGPSTRMHAIERAVQADPSGAFSFDATGAATLSAAGETWAAGRFALASIKELRSRALQAAGGRPVGARPARLWVLNGASPATDIGALQAGAQSDSLFQVASQFNCLESPGPYVTPVATYFQDSTQGPRAAISAFPGTLLRHYAAPGVGSERFVQASDARQVNLLANACSSTLAPVLNGYLSAARVTRRDALCRALEKNFDEIQVGVHDDVQVALGYNWHGAVEGSQRRRVAQVFTSTLECGSAAGFECVCLQLLRAAYLGTLLAAVSLGKTRVVLTLIGGGVFGNPIALILEAIQWALAETDRVLARDLDVVINCREALPLGWILDPVRARGGAVLDVDRDGRPAIRR